MRGALGIPVTVALLACSFGVISPGEAAAGHQSKDCGVLSHGARDYRIHATKVRCKTARQGANRYLRTHEPRAGFDCAPTAGGSFYCQDPPKAYWGIRL